MSSSRGGIRAAIYCTKRFSGEEPLLARCCGAGRPQNQPRGNVVLFLGGSPQSGYRGPRVRVIAPEKEVMIGGVCRNPMEGFGGRTRSPKVVLLARKSRASTRSCIAVSSSARPRACLGREGGPEQPGSKQKAIIEAPFARRRNFGPATSTCSSDHMVLVSSCEGQHMTHLGRNLLRALTSARFTATSLLPRANEDPTAAGLAVHAIYAAQQAPQVLISAVSAQWPSSAQATSGL